MNKGLGNIIFKVLFAALLLMSNAAMAQRESGNEGGSNTSVIHVTVGGNVFGGGKLAPVAGNTEVIINQRGATVDSSVYGGGALANVGTDNTNTTRVLLLDGIINGNVYGGGLGDSIGNGYFGESNVAAMVFGKVFVEVGLAPEDPNNPNTNNGQPYGNITINGDVFGCNNINGTPKDDVRVNIYRTAHTTGDNNNQYPLGVVMTLDELDVLDPNDVNYNKKFAISAVYGGGNRASYLPNPVAADADPHNTTVYVWGCTENTVKTVYGGGNAADVGTPTNIVNTNIIIDGGRFDRVFGGGNGYSADHNHTKPYKEDGGDCTATPTSAPCEDYNPGANISGTASTSIFGGLARQVFGASNQYGNLNGVSLYIEKRCDDDTLLIFETFGGGNEADITGHLTTTLGCSDYMIGTFYGGSNLADVNGNVTLNVEGGNYINVFGGSKGRLANTSVEPEITEKAANINGTVTLNLHGGNIVNAFGGNDVKGRISGLITVNLLEQGGCGLQIDTIYGGGRDAEYAPDSISGKKIIGPLVNLLHGTVGHYEGQNLVHGCVFGGGKGTRAVVKAHPKVTIGDTITSGPDASIHQNYQVTVLGSVFGGGNAAEVDGIDSVLMVKANNEVINLFGGGNKAVADTAVVIMTAGTVDTIFGGGNLAGLYGSALVIVSDGLVQKGIYGGCNKSGNVDDDITVNLNGGTVGATGTGNEANVHGGGYGSGTSTSSNVEVNIAQTGATSGPTIHGDVYGGSADGSVNSDEESSTNHTWVTLNAGTVNGSVYGGGLGITNDDCNVYGDVKVTVIGGSINTTSNTNVTSGSVFGCNNKKGAPQKTVEVIIEESTATGAPNMTVTNVYGGGNLAPCSVSPTVYINNGTVGGSVFGGGLGASAIVAGSPSVTIGTANSSDGYQAIVSGDVYGGGDMANVRGETTVLVQKCNTIINGDVYGGGNAAHILMDETQQSGGTTSVTVTGGTITGTNHGMVFGGGHGDKDASPAVAANVAVSTSVTINGGTIYQVYGGSNSLGSINSGNSGGINVLVDKANDACDLHITELYGGGNYAASQAGNIDIRCTGTVENANEGINYVYGGANRANVTGPIELTIDEGRIDYVFGGNNNSGDITGDITVTIEKKADPCVWEVGDVFGGGNLAIYEGTPVVNVKNGTVANVFGGGNGNPNDATQVPGQVAGTIVTIGDDNVGHFAIVTGNVYGGGNAAKVDGNTLVTYNDNNSDDANVNNSQVTKLFGGGNLAGVTGTTTVTLTDGRVVTGVYGGCNEKGNVGGNITVNINGGTVGSQSNLSSHITGDVFGGGYGGYVNESNPGTTTSGNVVVNINDGTIYGNVYGGSSFGDVNASVSDSTIVNIMGGTLETSSEEVVGGTVNHTDYYIYHGGNVFGGGLGQKEAAGVTPYEAKVNGIVIVNIGTGTLDNSTPGSDYNEVTGLDGNATIKGNVYGCNNQNGSPQENVIVNVFQTAHTDGTGGTVDNTVGGTAYALHDVFGGGNQADFRVDGKTATVYIYTCANTIERTFSGGNAAATNSVRTMIQGGRIREVYGGGNGEVSPANVDGTVTLDIHGGQIGQSYAGSNQQGTIAQGSTVNADDLGPCGGGTNVNEFFCGGNYANYIGDINATITCNGRMVVDNLYGGCNQAHVVHKGTPGQPDYEPGNITLTVYGGTYKNIYGGSKGTPTKGADVEGSIILNIHGGTITEAIFGGSNIKGAIGGTITVNVEDKVTTDQCPLDVSIADVYGGGNMADYPGIPADDSPITAPINHPDDYNYPMINIKNATVKNVFGGGLKAEVKGNPQVRIKKGSRVLGNVYGGGNLGEVIGNPRVIINGKDNTNNPTGL